jgi:NADH:ubiquinone oxidoreductase subunit 3 (subunit A)
MSFRLYDYLPILLMFIVAAGFAVGNVLLSTFVGQRKRTRTKLMPYECGKDPVGSARERFSVKFYLIAMIFILFDIEVIFSCPGRRVQGARGARAGDALVCIPRDDDLHRTAVCRLHLHRQEGRV